MYTYGRVRLTSYLELLTKLRFYTVVEKCGLIQGCWLVAGRSGQVFFGFGLLWGWVGLFMIPRGAPMGSGRMPY